MSTCKMELKVVEARKLEGGDEMKGKNFFVRFYMKSEKDYVEAVDTKCALGCHGSVKVNESFCLENSYCCCGNEMDEKMQEQKMVFELRVKKSGFSKIWRTNSSQLVGMVEISMHELASSRNGLFSLMKNNTQHMGVLHLEVTTSHCQGMTRNLREKHHGLRRRMENLDRCDCGCIGCQGQDALLNLL